MTSYVVMEPPQPVGKTLPEFVRDRFSVIAFLAPPLWLLWHRLWIEAALAFGLMLIIPALAARFGVGPVAPALSLLVSFFVALEGPALRLAAYRRRGWADGGVFEADDLEDAETRYADINPGPWSAKSA